MDYIGSLRYLYSLADFERSGRFADRPDVEPVRALLAELGDPHLGRVTIHIAGSKGKGSLAAMVESMLRATGLTTGLFTSPHLHRFPERIQISGLLSGYSPSLKSERGQGSEVGPLAPVSTDEFAEGVTEVAAAIERVRERIPDRAFVTFDALTALGFWVFRRHEVQVQVIEVGLGGLLDSTNVFQKPAHTASDPATAMPRVSTRGAPPHITVITNIGLEHREILGDTVQEIARQKAGIIVPGAPVIMAPQRESAADVIREVASEKGAPLTEVALACNLQRDAAGSEHQTFRLRTGKASYTIRLPLLGKHQLDNAATAVLAVESLSSAGIEVNVEAVQRGLDSVRWPGRIEVLKRRPLLVVDSAHTADSARRLRETLEEYLGIRQATLVIGVMGDKDLEGLAAAIEPVARRVIATQAGHPRALPAGQVASVFQARGTEAYTEPKLAAAIESALALSTGSEAIVILGSVALAGDARAYILGLERDPLL